MHIRSFENYQPKLAERVYVDPMASIIGQVILAADSSVWPMAVLRGDLNTIKIGARSNLQDGSVLHVVPDYEYCHGGLKVVLGDDVTIGHGVILHGCTVGDRCLIGMNSTVLDGAVIEDEVIVGANSLVPPKKALKKGFLYFGNPLKEVRELKPIEIEQIKYNAALYVELKNRFLCEQK
ncbi:MAG: gamma carbonic anhydrase family protein [Gammaproteobacteria bacterium GWF2_41_13]|nr:MAG: gamma carbonic anhydrase family protein [Gammaproteobacteria bacterium GWF2_41_13]